MIGCLPMQVLAFLAVFVYAMQAIAFEWKLGLSQLRYYPIAIPRWIRCLLTYEL